MQGQPAKGLLMVCRWLHGSTEQQGVLRSGWWQQAEEAISNGKIDPDDDETVCMVEVP